MADAAEGPSSVLSIPSGGGALRGIGETFVADPQTGAGSYAVPIATPAGRHGLAPTLSLAYSTGTGNGPWGLGWDVAVPGIARRTRLGTPTYDDDRDTFVLSGSEDLVVMGPTADGGVQYRPQTEGLYARIVHHRGPGARDLWEVTTKDGLVSTYGSVPDGTPGWRDPAVCADPDEPARIFAWRLTRTTDPLGNVIVYDYDQDEGTDGPHRWRQPLLRGIRYADHDVAGTTEFFAGVTFADEPRPDPFSSYAAGFEIRTTRRYASVTTVVRPGTDTTVRRYEVTYVADALSAVSRLASVAVVGFDDDGAEHRDMPAVLFTYSVLDSAARALVPVGGPDLPTTPLSDPAVELVDLVGDGLPDLLGSGHGYRYWRNRGDGTFDAGRPLPDGPVQGELGSPGVRLLDADGDGRADLMVATAAETATYPLRYGPSWGQRRAMPDGVSPPLTDPRLKLVDLDRDGVTDALWSDGTLRCWFADPVQGWSGPVAARIPADDRGTVLDLADPRIRIADMTGDGASDLVVLRGREVGYWPQLGRGRFGEYVRMADVPDLPSDTEVTRLQLADVTGDGAADLVLATSDAVLIWVNRCGNSWSAPVVVRGLPSAGWDVRVVDLTGSGVGGVLCTRSSRPGGRPAAYFLDLSGGVKPGLLVGVDNQLGASTSIEYTSSSRLAAADHLDLAHRWRTPLPFPTPVVAAMTTEDLIAKCTSSTQYRYRHGYWDGRRREFRGFGVVEQTDIAVREGQSLSAPLLTRTWFHLGDVDVRPDAPDAQRWSELDLSDGYWPGDGQLLGHTAAVAAQLVTIDDPEARRDALRALRGRPLRSEVYGLDGSARADAPYSVTEYAYTLRREASAGRAVFAVFETARRGSRWERGDDPVTVFTFTADHDDVGQPGAVATVTPPRRSARRSALTAAVVGTVDVDPATVTATLERTRYAADDAGAGIRDRVADMRLLTLRTPRRVDEQTPGDVAAVLADQYRAAAEARDQLLAGAPDEVTLLGHTVHHYDGDAYVGLAPGTLGAHGLLTRTATLVHTDAGLDAALGSWRPAYLGGPAALPAGAPAGFGDDLGFTVQDADDWHVAGRYADSASTAYDVQLWTAAAPNAARGVVLGTRDPLGRETVLTPDPFWLVPVAVRDPLGLTTTAVPHHRTGKISLITDPNGTQTHATYDALGMVTSTYRVGTDGRAGTPDRPEVAFSYDLGAWRDRGEPVSMRTARRTAYASDGPADDVLDSWEYYDGFGRIVQQRARTDELAFGAEGDDAGLLVAGAAGEPPTPVPGATGGPAAGTRDAERVVVSGLQVYDDKGRVIAKHPPFLDTGVAYREATPSARPVRMAYDPMGRLVRVDNPDGSRRRTVFGVPGDLADPDSAAPTPWATTAYDENDLAGAGGAVPEPQLHTPTTVVLDGLGRTVAQLCRGSRDSAGAHLTRTVHDVRGNVVTVVDEHGRTARDQAYDALNRLVRVDGIDAGRQMSVVDAAGSPRHTRNARGAETLRSYDRGGRLARVDACDAAGTAATQRERCTYGDDDPDRAAALTARRLGRLWRQLDEAGSLEIEDYDLTGAVGTRARQVVADAVLAAADSADGWVADWATADPATVLDQRVERTTAVRDALGRVIELTAPEDATGHRSVTTSTYGRAGGLSGVLVDGSVRVGPIVRNARGQRVLAVLGNGLVARYAYDPDTFRLVRLRTERATAAGDTWTGTGAPLQDLTFTYDPLGNVVSVEDRTPGCGVAATPEGRDRLVRTFAHDGFGRLVAATGRECAAIAAPRATDDAARCGAYGALFSPPPAAPNQANAPDVTAGYREEYTYSPAGDLVDLHHVGAAAGSEWHRGFGLDGHTPDEWAIAGNGHLTSVVAGGVTSSLAQDAGGNLVTENGTRTFSWDHGGRMVGFRVKAGAGTSVSARYLYDAAGLRVKKWVRLGDTAALDSATVYVDDVFERHTWRKAGGGTQTLLHTSDDTTRIAVDRTGDTHPDDAGPPLRYELSDHLGSAAITVDDSGGWINREEYFPYGETSFGSFARKRYRFTGRERDEESGLNHHGARYLFPGTARWISPDPAGPVDGLNLYAYARGNPVALVDTSGLAANPPTDQQSTAAPMCTGADVASSQEPEKKSSGASEAASATSAARGVIEEVVRPRNVNGASAEGMLHLWSGSGKADAKAAIAAEKSGWMMGDIKGAPTPQHAAAEATYAEAMAKSGGAKLPSKEFEGIWGPPSAEVVGRGAFSGHPVESHYGPSGPGPIQSKFELPALKLGGLLHGSFGTGTGMFSAITGALDKNPAVAASLALSGVGEATSALMYGAGAYGLSTTAMSIGTAGMSFFGGAGAAIGFGVESYRSFEKGDRLSGWVNLAGAVGGALLIAAAFTPVGALAGVVLVSFAAGYNLGKFFSR